MLKVKINDKFDFEVMETSDPVLVNGQELPVEVHEIGSGRFQVFRDNQVFNAEVVGYNRVEKTCSIRVNSGVYSVQVTDRFDILLQQLGIDSLNSRAVAELKAPMPGLVLKVLVSEGDEVKKGDNLLILEAMKMENIIKAPGDAVIKAIKITASDKVEKNQVLILFA